jgi:hypothetical protein
MSKPSLPLIPRPDDIFSLDFPSNESSQPAQNKSQVIPSTISSLYNDGDDPDTVLSGRPFLARRAMPASLHPTDILQIILALVGIAM